MQPKTHQTRSAHALRSSFVSVTNRDGVITVRPAGPRLLEREAVIIAADVKPLISHVGGGLRRLVIDLSEIGMMSSFGLGMCIELRNVARSLNATTVLYGLSDELEELVRMLKVDRLYTMAASANELAQAIAA